jgi:hypothetical protein
MVTSLVSATLIFWGQFLCPALGDRSHHRSLSSQHTRQLFLLIASNFVARRTRGNALAPCAVNCNTSCLQRAMSNKNQICLSGAITCAQQAMYEPLKTSAHGATLLLSTNCLQWARKVDATSKTQNRNFFSEKVKQLGDVTKGVRTQCVTHSQKCWKAQPCPCRQHLPQDKC